MLTCAHTAWKSTSAPLFFCTSGKQTVENLKISPGQLAPCQEKRIKRRQTVSSAGCKVLIPNAGFLLASVSSYCRFRPIECSYSQSVSVLVPQDKIRGSAIERRIVNGVVASVDESRELTSLLQQLFSSVNSNEAAWKDIEDALTACVANLVPQMSSAKGSAGYWKKQSRRVLSMVKSLIMKAPTFFVTLTAADSLWIDFLRLAEPSMSDHELQKLSAVQKADLLAHHADLAVDHFDHRWTSFWQHVLKGEGKPLGNIADYFWRIEFQERGSPHVRMLLWVQEAEGSSFSNSDALPEDILQFIDSTIYSKLDLSAAADVVEGATHPCSLLLPEHPLRSSDTTQYVERLAQAVQMHRCNKYCKPAGQHSACRFGFPRPHRDHTSVEMVYRNKRTRMVVSTKRNHSRLNAFFPALLAFWAANMDIQYLYRDSFGAAVYTASYLC